MSDIHHHKILILDFGSQYTQLIARRVRELHVYCEIHPFNSFPEPDIDVKGVILSGSPFSVRDENSPKDRFKTRMSFIMASDIVSSPNYFLSL